MTSPLEVEVNGDLEKAFKNLKKKMAFEGIFKELKKRRYYEKPSAQKKRKREEAERRRIKKMRKFTTSVSPRKFVNPNYRNQNQNQNQSKDTQNK